MSSKTLTANVKLNTKSAEASLNSLTKKINNVQKAITKTGTNAKLTNAINKAVTSTNKLTTATNKWATATNKVASTTAKVATTAKKVNAANQQAANSARQMSSAYRSSNASANSLLTTVKRLASTYLGVMGTKAVITASDTITSSENRLNALNGNNSDLTQASMDKIYSAAQRSRSGYGDMLGNVSKSMTLAGDAFQGNVDNAIRFQEIMSKAYTIGGASAAEQSSSMYQLVQALGSGILQGDELRSVREGAPIAYKKIEEFCQGVLNTEESLKDLASQGVVTSDMIVAAIMNAEEEINASFENTSMTFAQAWDQIKNTALKAFEPVLQKLNDMLNSDLGRSVIDGICKGLVLLAKTAEWVLTVLETFFNWCADNWEWLKYIIIGALTVIIALLAKMAWQAIVTAVTSVVNFVMMHWQLLLIVAAIMAILYVYELWRQGTISTVEGIIAILLILAAICLVLGIVMGQMWLIWVAVALIAIALIMMYFAELCGYINVGIQAIVNAWFWCCNLVLGVWNWCCALISNIWNWVCNVFHGCVNWISALWDNCVAGLVNVAMGLWNSIKAIAQNIGIAFENAWIGAQNMFWSFIEGVLSGLKGLESPINAIVQALGGEGFTLSGLIDKIGAKQQGYKSYVNVSDAWNSGMSTKSYQSLGEAWSSGYNTNSYESLGDAWSKGWNTYDVFEKGWASDAYDSGYNWGQGIENAINEWGSQFQTQSGSDSGLLTDISEMLGLNDLTSGLINPTDPAYGVGGGYDPTGANDDIKDALGKLGNIDDNTGSMADSMDLAEEDLEYLRKIADMEWKKEFTTATITVDMSNYNTISGDSDLDGIVEKLADKLYDEMNAVANGVYS